MPQEKNTKEKYKIKNVVDRFRSSVGPLVYKNWLLSDFNVQLC